MTEVLYFYMEVSSSVGALMLFYMIVPTGGIIWGKLDDLENDERLEISD